MPPTRRLIFGAAAALAAPAVARAQAAPYPSRPVRVIVPFPPGGATDAVGRLTAERLSAVISRHVRERAQFSFG